MGGRVTYALGYTGLGVGASRWAAGVVRDFILRPESDLLKLRFVQSTAGPVPARAVPVRGGQPGPPRAGPRRPQRGPARASCSRPLDALGIGFDS